MSFSTFDFRRTMSLFATGITTVTTVLNDKYHGITVNAFCSVSLEPPMVLISIEKAAFTHEVLQQSKVYAVNILSANQQALSERFARHESQGGKTFEDIRLHFGPTGSPLFDEALACLDCKIVAEYEGGDHTLFLGEVLNLQYLENEETYESDPLLYYRSRYRVLKD